MGYAKERGKLEKLLRIVGLNTYDEKSFAALVDTHEKYSHTVRILKNKEPETFGDLYKNELEEVKISRKAVKDADSDETRQSTFIAYKETLLRALNNTIQATNETL
ncbi:hypothetical protein TH53_01645 [Pedobacter lusitanus]|uniref:Uncharacterized protein n=1 Tax=Pedobacter lusitanus TaxID=1503925 RepID=A0A0D0G203_9SPHI|nr:hypothetical protein [Pedobacter lusitanus]KIO78814.1 hypothetical protein TH53_01645 [Pedobacter lusitanus]